MEQQTTFISAVVPKSLAIAARVFASKRNISRSQLIREALEKIMIPEEKRENEQIENKVT